MLHNSSNITKTAIDTIHTDQKNSGLKGSAVWSCSMDFLSHIACQRRPNLAASQNADNANSKKHLLFSQHMLQQPWSLSWNLAYNIVGDVLVMLLSYDKTKNNYSHLKTPTKIFNLLLAFWHFRIHSKFIVI